MISGFRNQNCKDSCTSTGQSCGVPRFWSLRQGRALLTEFLRAARFARGDRLVIPVAPRPKTRPCRGLQNLQNPPKPWHPEFRFSRVLSLDSPSRHQLITTATTHQFWRFAPLNGIHSSQELGTVPSIKRRSSDVSTLPRNRIRPSHTTTGTQVPNFSTSAGSASISVRTGSGNQRTWRLRVSRASSQRWQP